MPSFRQLRWTLAVGAICLGGVWSRAQAQVVVPDATVSGALRSLAARAGVAFVGQVVRIERNGGVVEITFRVDQAVLGGVSGSYTLREWAGLWPPGEHRYVAGQRLLIFLHAAGASGLSSPVDGMEGMVPVVPQGADTPSLLDVRRLNARLLRARGTALPNNAAGAMALADATRVVANWNRPAGPEPAQVPLSGRAETSSLLLAPPGSTDAVR
ncbi:MAG: hypothetical protein V4555_09600 [Acidobacteriota bacterium]